MTLKRCILYYPTISIPSRRWLKKTILYWDEVGSIVPKRYEESAPIPYTPVVQHLMNEGLFKPFRPENLFNQGWEKSEQFEQEFMKIIQSNQFQSFMNRRKFYFSRQNLPLLSRILEDKVPYNLFKFLEERGLAKNDNERHSLEWLYFENNTLLLYMALLAKYLADDSLEYTIPGTDHSIYENMIFQALSPDDGISCIRTNFENCLPIPRDDVSIKSIIEFKRKRHDELLHFRQEIDNFQKTLRQCQERSEVGEATVAFKENLERNVRDLEAVMGDARISVLAGSLKTLIKVDSPTLWATAGVVAGQATKIADIPLQWSAIGIGILGTIEITSYLVDKSNEQRASLRNSPFAYLYHANQENILAKRKAG